MNQSQQPAEIHFNDDTQGLLFEASPYGNLDAIVQHDNRVVYFYLNGPEPFGTRACWVRNLQPGPLVLNQDQMAAGIPPMLPRTHCIRADGQPLPDAHDLDIVWLEEGNGAALRERGQTIAVIPPWSGIDGFHGYATACASESPLCWPMPDNPQLRTRIQRAAEFWRSCENESNHPFAVLQPRILQTYQRRFGKQESYFALDGGQFPPRGAAVYRLANGSRGDRVVIATVGMSFRPMPNVENFAETPAALRRIELAISLSCSASDRELQSLLEQISGLAVYPWQHWTWYGPAHTCGLSAVGPLIGPQFQFIVFVSESQLGTTGAARIPDFRGDPVQIMWMLPITGDEQRSLEKREIELAQILTGDRKPTIFFDR